jgi:hypothetical protein
MGSSLTISAKKEQKMKACLFSKMPLSKVIIGLLRTILVLFFGLIGSILLLALFFRAYAMYTTVMQIIVWLIFFALFSRSKKDYYDWSWNKVKEKNKWPWIFIVLGDVLTIWVASLLYKLNASPYLLIGYFIGVGIFISGLHLLLKKKNIREK